MIQEAHMRQSEREPLKEIEAWKKNMAELIEEMEAIEKRIAGGINR